MTYELSDDNHDNNYFYDRKKEEKAIEDAEKGIFYVMKEAVKR